MPDLKISQMNPAPLVDNADLIPIVQAGANFFATRDQLLIAHAEPITFGNDVGYVLQVDGSNNWSLFFGPGVASAFTLDALGNVVLGVCTTFSVVGPGSAEITIDAAGEINLTPAPGFTVQIFYSPASPGDWSGLPTDLVSAVDRIAAAVAGLLGGPIP